MTTRAKIELSVNGVHIGRFHKYRSAGAVLGGDWDSCEAKFDHSVYFQSLYSHFVEGTNWKDTILVREVVNLIDQKGSAWHGCVSKGDVKKRCEYIDELYERICEEGYRSQKDLKENCSLRERLDEVTVNIGRNGDLIYNSSGAHRLAIAKILELDQIPVRPHVTHSQWVPNTIHLSR